MEKQTSGIAAATELGATDFFSLSDSFGGGGQRPTVLYVIGGSMAGRRRPNRFIFFFFLTYPRRCPRKTNDDD